MRAVSPVPHIKLRRPTLGFDLEKPHASVLLEALYGLNRRGEVPPRQLILEDVSSGLVKLVDFSKHANLFSCAVLNRKVSLGVAEWENLANPSCQDRQLLFDFDPRLRRAFGQSRLHPAAVEISDLRSSHLTIMKPVKRST